MIRRPFLLGAACLLLFSSCGQQRSADRSAEAGKTVGTAFEWTNNNGDTDETGYSRLDKINDGNVDELGLAWSLELPGEASLEATPLAVGGMLYFTGSQAVVYAVDAATGKVAWTYDPKTWEHNPEKMHYGFGANRGSAYADGKIFSAALDGRLLALDAKTGKLIWSVETTAPDAPQTITGAPRVFNGKVIVGQGGADFGARGYVTAYDQKTGKQLWRFYVVPGSPEEDKGKPAMEAAAKTWNGEWWKTGTGGGPWDSITFDAELNRVYVGTANAYPYDSSVRSPGRGDNLYTASIVALDADTGKYVWHYQINPRDSWDYDCSQQMTLANLEIDGKVRKVLMQAPKNGFFYVLDRENGKVISAGKIGKVNWADSIDLKTGRPVEKPNIRYENGESVIYPFTSGAHSWMRMAYSPMTGAVYVPIMQLGTIFRRGEPVEGGINVAGINMGESKVDPEDGKGKLVAWDPVAQKPLWQVQHDTLWNGGTVATAGNLVFQGTADGYLNAYNAKTGERLWNFYSGMGIIAAPMTWELDGKQYVSVLAGYGGSAAILSPRMNVGWKYSGPRRLLTFALGGKARLPDSPKATMAVAAVDDPAMKINPADVAAGQAMTMACAACHGRFLVGAGGPAPDLRESAIALDKAAFQSVVRDGALISRGMPRFDKMFSPQQVEQIRAYVRSRARETLAERGKGRASKS